MNTFRVETMTCGGCAAAITRTINAVDGKARVTAFPTTRLLKVESELDAKQILLLLEHAGYPGKLEEQP